MWQNIKKLNRVVNPLPEDCFIKFSEVPFVSVEPKLDVADQNHQLTQQLSLQQYLITKI